MATIAANEETTQRDLETLIRAMLVLHRLDGALVLWHRTPAATQILRGGFRDGGTDGGFILAGTSLAIEGVFVSNRPLDSNEGAKGRELLRILLSLTEEAIADFEVVDESGESTYREWCIPAALLNANGRVELSTADAEVGNA